MARGVCDAPNAAATMSTVRDSVAGFTPNAQAPAM
jgi:hypothetical protein